MHAPTTTTNPTASYQKHRTIVAATIKHHGIRRTARETGLTKNAVSRYCTGKGSDDALTHYILSTVVGRPLRQPRRSPNK